VRELVRKIQVQSVLNKQKFVDDWFLSSYSINPYSNCSFNCVYCYTRGSKYGEHQVPSLAAKINAPEVLVRQLKTRARKREYGFIVLGSATDPYLPVEKDLKITRELLMIILRFKFPINILTRSPLILRDLDLLKKIGEKAIIPKELEGKMDTGVVLSFSFSTTDEKLARIFEPGVPSLKKRLDTIKKCKDAGFTVGAVFMPLLPFLSDSEEHLDKMFKDVKENGVDFVLASGLTLYGDGPYDCKTRYYEVLEEHFPELVPKTRAIFGKSSAPSHKYQKQLYQRFLGLCRKYSIRNKIY
jgi:DNA repair photolyase